MSSKQTVVVRSFAVLREYFGEVTHLAVDRDATVEVVLAELGALRREAVPILAVSRAATGTRFVRREERVDALEAGELCVLPPSSGG